MRIIERMPGDVEELRRPAAAEKNALRRDRCRAVLLAIEGQEATQTAKALGQARRSVQDWAYAYRDGGTDAVQPKRRVGRRAHLAAGDQTRLRGRLDPGPTDIDGVSALLRRIGYSGLSSRPRHRKNDPAAMQRFTKTDAPILPASSRTNIPPRPPADS